MALGIALLWTLVTWGRLAAEAWLPWSLQVVLAGVTFFSTLGIAWVLGALGGTLGWFIGRRRGKADRGPVGGRAGGAGGAGGLVQVPGGGPRAQGGRPAHPADKSARGAVGAAARDQRVSPGRGAPPRRGTHRCSPDR